MADPLITELEDRRVLDSFNSDGLIPKVFKALNCHISSVLSRVFNRSVQIVQVAECWRRAIVTPTPKTPRSTDPRPFRPICPTSVVCNMLETIFREKLLSHLSQLSLLTTRQHGFLPRRSPLTNLLSAEETVTHWLDEGDTIDIVYMDFAKII